MSCDSQKLQLSDENMAFKIWVQWPKIFFWKAFHRWTDNNLRNDKMKNLWEDNKSHLKSSKSVASMSSIDVKFNDFGYKIKEKRAGRWCWSSGQHACLILLQSEFQSWWGLHFFCTICVWKEQKWIKRAGVGSFKKQIEDWNIIKLCA